MTRTAIRIILLILSLMILLTLVGIIVRQTQPSSHAGDFRLQSYHGALALYRGDELIRVYRDVVISDLPASDRNELKQGLRFPTRDAAELAAEDYDG